jgi:hypothetical protein
MKNKKLLVLILSLALLISGILCVSVSAEAEVDPTEVSIYKKNLSFVNSPALAFAVAHDGSASKVILNVWNAEPAEGKAPDYVVTESSAQNVGGVNCSVFYINGKNPKNISEQVWVQAVAGDVKSETVRFSILEFALAGIADGTDVERYQSIIDYATSAQKWLGYTDANGKTADEYVYVTIEGGTVDGYSTGVYPKGTKITPIGENVSMWSVVSGGNNANVYYGQPITLNANTKITVNNIVETFENCTTPSDVENLTLKQEKNGDAFKITEFDGSKVLTVDTVNDGTTGRTEVIFNVDNKITGAEAVVLEFDLYVDVKNASGQTYAIEMRDSANVRIVYLTIDSSFKFNYIGANGGQGINSTLATDKWMRFRVEYIDLGETMGLKVYVDGNCVLVLDDYKTSYSPASREIDAITNVRFDTYGEIVTHFDNVMLVQEKIENLDKVITFDDGKLPANIDKLTDATTVNVVNDPEKGNVLDFTADAWGEGINIPVMDKETGANCAVFEADMSLNITGSEGVRFNMHNTAAAASAKHNLWFEVKKDLNDSSKLVFVLYTDSQCYSKTRIEVANNTNSDWFNLRVEYYEGTRETVRTKVYLNGILVYVTDAFRVNNVCGCETHGASLTPAAISDMQYIRIRDDYGAYAGTMLIDNIRFEHVVKACADDPLIE